MMLRAGTAKRLALTIAFVIAPGLAAPAIGGESVPRGAASKDCAFCECYGRFARALEKATREVGALANGIVVHYHAEDPETVVEIQRFAFERHRLRKRAAADLNSVRLCSECRPRVERLKGAKYEVSNSVHGVFTLITSSDPEVVRFLHELASEQTQEGVRGS